MMKSIFTGLLLPVFSFAAPKPPQAEKIPHEMKMHGDVRNDPYYWVRDIKNPKVKKLLEAENKYYQSYYSPADMKLKKKIVEEIKTRIEEDETSAEIIYGDFAYFSKSIKGKNYRQFLRRNLKDSKVELLLDENIKAQGKQFFASRSRHESPDLSKVAWCFDYDGSGKCEIEIQDLKTKAWTKTGITGVHWGDIAWSPDSLSLFYVLPNDAWRPDSVWMYTLSGEKKKVLAENDELFNLGLSLSSDEKVVLATSASFETSKSFYWTGTEFKELYPSKEKVLAEPNHSSLGYFVVSNHQNKNFGVYQFEK